jgi:dihydroflavonol-4-reductase
MRVAVTGASGFLGSHVVQRLRSQGHTIVALRRAAAAQPLDDGVEWVVGDLGDVDAVGRLVAGCDAAVHAAAVLTYWRGAAAAHRRVNVEGTAVVAAAARAAGVARLVHVSSVAALDEDPSLSYHASKRDAERVVLDEVERGLDAVIVRPATIHGPHRETFRGARLVEGVRRRRVVPHYRGGTSIVHVDDVVDGTLRALERGRTGERYVLAGENHTWRALAQIAAEELGVRRTFVPVPRTATALAALVGETASRFTGRRPPLTRDTHLAASRFLYYDSEQAVRELDYHFRPYREIVREYLRR